MSQLGEEQPPDRVVEAQRVYDEAAAALGLEDLDTLNARHELARAYAAAENWSAAAAEYEPLVASVSRLVDDDHPALLQIREGYAFCLNQLGDSRGAIAQLEVRLDSLAGGVGDEHPSVLESRAIIAVVLAQSGQVAAAARQLNAVENDAVRVLGPDHPVVVRIRRAVENLPAAGPVRPGAARPNRKSGKTPDGGFAAFNSRIGKVGEGRLAVPEAQRRLQTLSGQYGAAHRDVLGARLDLAAVLMLAGEDAAAVKHFEAVASVAGDAYGDSDPLVLEARTAATLIVTVFNPTQS